MTPKEKAKELVDRFKYGVLVFENFYQSHIESAKQCALICVDEILAIDPMRREYFEGTPIRLIDNTQFWKEVKQEINNL